MAIFKISDIIDLGLCLDMHKKV